MGSSFHINKQFTILKKIMAFCTKCGKPNSEDVKFCTSCGNKMIVVTATNKVVEETHKQQQKTEEKLQANISEQAVKPITVSGTSKSKNKKRLLVSAAIIIGIAILIVAVKFILLNLPHKIESVTGTNLSGVYTPNPNLGIGCASITLTKMCDGYACSIFYVGGSGSSTQSRLYKVDGSNLISPDRPNIEIVSDHITFEGAQYFIDKNQSQSIGKEQKCFIGSFKSTYSSVYVSSLYDQFDIEYNRNNKLVAAYEFTDYTNDGFTAFNDKLNQSLTVKLIDDNTVEVNGETLKRATDLKTSEESNATTLPLYAIVSSSRAYFYDTPNGNRRTAYLVSNDRIQALQEQSGYFFTIFTSPSGIATKGWINKNDLSYSTNNSSSNNLSYLKNLNGSCLDNTSFKQRLLNLLGNDFETLQGICCVSSGDEIIGNYFKSSQCESHNCSSSNYIILADLANNIIYVGIRKDDRVRTYSENGQRCQLLNDWINGN